MPCCVRSIVTAHSATDSNMTLERVQAAIEKVLRNVDRYVTDSEVKPGLFFPKEDAPGAT